jgi:hypothetical protein
VGTAEAIAAIRVRWVWCLDEGWEKRRWAAAYVYGVVVDIVADESCQDV